MFRYSEDKLTFHLAVYCDVGAITVISGLGCLRTHLAQPLSLWHNDYGCMASWGHLHYLHHPHLLHLVETLWYQSKEKVL